MSRFGRSSWRSTRPWLVFMPFLAAAIVVGTVGMIGRNRLYVGSAVFVLLWGAVWMWGIHRERGVAARIARTPDLKPPISGQATALGRVRRHLWSARRQLVASPDALLWSADRRLRALCPGASLRIDLPRGDEGGLETLATFAEIESCRLVVAAFGRDSVRLRLQDGRTVAFKLVDPVTGNLLIGALAQDDPT